MFSLLRIKPNQSDSRGFISKITTKPGKQFNGMSRGVSGAPLKQISKTRSRLGARSILPE